MDDAGQQMENGRSKRASSVTLRIEMRKIMEQKKVLMTASVPSMIGQFNMENIRILKELGYEPGDLARGGIKGLGQKISNCREMADRLGVGEITLKDIVSELEKPGRDPREEMPRPILRTDVLEMKDLKPGMVLKGTVRNVIDFGAFVDIGVHQDGLVHVSQMTERYIKHPLEAVSVGDIVEVKVLSVDLEKKRISLTMKL